MMPNGHALATSGGWRRAFQNDLSIRLWDLPSGRLRRAIETDHEIAVAQIAPDPLGRWLITVGQHLPSVNGSGITSDSVLRFWNAEDGELVGKIDTKYRGHLRPIAVALDGSWVAAFALGIYPNREDKSEPTVKVWSTTSRRLRHIIDTGPTTSHIAALGKGWLLTASGESGVLWRPGRRLARQTLAAAPASFALTASPQTPMQAGLRRPPTTRTTWCASGTSSPLAAARKLQLAIDAVSYSSLPHQTAAPS